MSEVEFKFKQATLKNFGKARGGSGMPVYYSAGGGKGKESCCLPAGHGTFFHTLRQGALKKFRAAKRRYKNSPKNVLQIYHKT